MEKLSSSCSSKRYLESKCGTKSELLSTEIQKSLIDTNNVAAEKNSDSDCILATDFSIVDRQMEDFQRQREKKGNIYEAFSEYIECLKDSLENVEDSYERFLIEKEIKKLEKEQKKYYVPSILEESKFDLVKNNEQSIKKDALEKSSFALVNKIRKK